MGATTSTAAEETMMIDIAVAIMTSMVHTMDRETQATEVISSNHISIIIRAGTGTAIVPDPTAILHQPPVIKNKATATTTSSIATTIVINHILITR